MMGSYMDCAVLDGEFGLNETGQNVYKWTHRKNMTSDWKMCGQGQPQIPESAQLFISFQ